MSWVWPGEGKKAEDLKPENFVVMRESKTKHFQSVHGERPAGPWGPSPLSKWRALLYNTFWKWLPRVTRSIRRDLKFILHLAISQSRCRYETRRQCKTPRNNYVYSSDIFVIFALYLQQWTSSPVMLSRLSRNRCYGLRPLLTSLLMSTLQAEPLVDVANLRAFLLLRGLIILYYFAIFVCRLWSNRW